MPGEAMCCLNPPVRATFAKPAGGRKTRRSGMKPLKPLGIVASMLAGIIAMCGLFGYVGSVLSKWGEPVHAGAQVPAKTKVASAPSNLEKAAVATAQEATDLPQ